MLIIRQEQIPADLYIVAQKNVPVYSFEKDAITLPSPKTGQKLVPYQRVQVIECIDVKHYLIYKIRMQNGKFGFINEGEYFLERNNKPAAC